MTFAGGFAVSRGGGVLADRALKLSHGALVASEEREGCAALGVSHERVVRDGVHLVVAEPVIAVMFFEVLEAVLDPPAAAQHVRQARRGGPQIAGQDLQRDLPVLIPGELPRLPVSVELDDLISDPQVAPASVDLHPRSARLGSRGREREPPRSKPTITRRPPQISCNWSSGLSIPLHRPSGGPEAKHTARQRSSTTTVSSRPGSA